MSPPPTLAVAMRSTGRPAESGWKIAESLARLEARSVRVDGCLLVPTDGYGEVYFDGQRLAAHRASYFVHNGEIPEGHVVRHTCDTVGCIEPSHLLTGTQRDNGQDMAARHRGLIGLRNHVVTVPPELVADAVAEYRRGGISQQALAHRLGVARSTVGRWVRAEDRRDVAASAFIVGTGSRHATGLAPCGTRAAYVRHKRNGTTPCEACRAANRAHWRARRSGAAA